LVNRSVTLPERFQTTYVPPLKALTLRVSSTMPVAWSIACTVSEAIR
jgi:hypothetical protein